MENINTFSALMLNIRYELSVINVANFPTQHIETITNALKPIFFLILSDGAVENQPVSRTDSKGQLALQRLFDCSAFLAPLPVRRRGKVRQNFTLTVDLDACKGWAFPIAKV